MIPVILAASQSHGPSEFQRRSQPIGCLLRLHLDASPDNLIAYGESESYLLCTHSSNDLAYMLHNLSDPLVFVLGEVKRRLDIETVKGDDADY